jgi:hypothetical protein
VTTQAPLRSRWTKAESAYHVRLTGNGDALLSPSKDTRLLGVSFTTILAGFHQFKLKTVLRKLFTDSVAA